MSEPDSGLELPFGECGPDGGSASATILLIHGAFAGRREWDLVIPRLSKSFHLLAPDLPEHGEAQHIAPFSKDLAVTLLARLIERKAINRRAHVIGFSLGAHVAVALAERHPAAVGQVFVSGFEVYASTPLFAHALWLSQRVESAIPASVSRWLMDGADVVSRDSTAATLAKSRNISRAMSTDRVWPSPWSARTLIVAAGKSGLLPTADHPHDAIRLRDIAQQLSPDTVAYTHPDLRHPWHRQAPDLCAETAIAWFSRAPLPGGFRAL